MANLNINDELRAFAEAQARKEGLSGPDAYVEALLSNVKLHAEEGNGTGCGIPAVADFYQEQSLEELAARQGVKPVTDFGSLLGDFWPEDETADDFIAAVREWRREGPKGAAS